MKKFLYIIGFLMFSSALFSPLVSFTAYGQAQSQGVGYKEGCNFPWLTCGNLVNIPDTDWGATFGETDPEQAGQDLYKNVLKMTRVMPDKKAFKNTTGAFGATESEMTRLLQNDIGPILDKSPYLTQDQAIAKMIQIQQRYQDEKDIFALQADIDAAVTPNEIFANGDTSDSGFDLINDLNNIENILFKKMDPIDVGGAFNGASGSGSAAGAPGPGPSGSKTGPTSAPGGTSGGETTGTTSSALTGGGGPSGGTQQAVPAAATNSGLGPTPSAAENPNICFADNKLDNALKDFDQNKLTDPRLQETSTQPSAESLVIAPPPPPPSPSPSPSPTPSPSPSPGPSPSPTPQPSPPPASPPAEQIPVVQPAPAANWLKTPPCNDVLCIQINFVKKTATAYVDSDNCIACHVEKINAKLKETINHSLIPGKATGNLLEPGICKQATADLFANVGMRFYAVAKPVKTPTNDDLIYGTNATDEWDKFVNNYKPFPFYSKKVPDPNDPSQDPFVPTLPDEAAKAAVAFATPDTTVSAANTAVSQSVAGREQAIAKAVAVAEPATSSEVQGGFFQAIQREMEQMNFYFSSFQNILHRLHEDVGGLTEDHACQQLQDKGQCT